MNQFNHSGTFNKSPSALTKPSSPTYQGYAHFTKFNIPELSKSSFVKPPHMSSSDYLNHHANKPDVENKLIAINDFEEGVKLSILSDIERDQRLQAFQEAFNRSNEQINANQAVFEAKRKADHEAFDRFVKRSGAEKSELDMKYEQLFRNYTNLQKAYDELKKQHTDAQIQIDGSILENGRLSTLLQ